MLTHLTISSIQCRFQVANFNVWPGHTEESIVLVATNLVDNGVELWSESLLQRLQINQTLMLSHVPVQAVHRGWEHMAAEMWTLCPFQELKVITRQGCTYLLKAREPRVKWPLDPNSLKTLWTLERNDEEAHRIFLQAWCTCNRLRDNSKEHTV